MLITTDDSARANRPLILVGLTGMPGGGKSTAGRALESLGTPRIVMGDVIREETKRRGLDANPENTGRVMRELREKFGETAVAELCLEKIRGLAASAAVVDGIRSTAEVDAFRRVGDVLIVAIHASRRRRYQLLRERGRSDDPPDWTTFLSRDERELSIGVGNAIALADEAVSNEHETPEQLGRAVVELVQAWRRTIVK